MRSDTKVDEHGQVAILAMHLDIALVELLKVLGAVGEVLVGELLCDELAVGDIEYAGAIVVVVP